MDIYVYSDESGVFDINHNEYYVYGGVIFLNKNDRDVMNRKYKNIERTLKNDNENFKNVEIKANILNGKQKYKIMNATSDIIKFGIIINQKEIHKKIFADKKDKQRYLDYAYKIGIKDCFKKLIAERRIKKDEVENIYVFVDEHTTATNGKYDFKEGLLQEFKRGTFNSNYEIYFEPIFKNLKNLEVKHCKSEKIPMIRLADITANYLYGGILNDKPIQKTIYIKMLP